MRIGWVNGWAVPESWLRPQVSGVLPEAEHVIVPSSREAIAQLRAAGTFDWIAGYSLGAHLLLRETDETPLAEHVALLAPIWTFPAEAGQGGRVTRGQLRQLRRWLLRDATGALDDFYRRAGLDIPSSAPSDWERDELEWGIEQLESGVLTPSLPAGWKAWCGADDALLDGRRLQALVPAVRIVGKGTHHPRELLRAFAKEIE